MGSMRGAIRVPTAAPWPREDHGPRSSDRGRIKPVTSMPVDVRPISTDVSSIVVLPSAAVLTVASAISVSPSGCASVSSTLLGADPGRQDPRSKCSGAPSLASQLRCDDSRKPFRSLQLCVQVMGDSVTGRVGDHFPASRLRRRHSARG